MQKATTRQQLFKLILTAILISLNFVLERIVPSYKILSQDINFGFIAIAFAASFLGIPYAIAVAGLGDLLGSLLMPFGPYFPGFTATNCVYGLILALALYKNATLPKVVLGVLVNKIVCSMLLNNLWIAMLYYGGVHTFFAVLATRLPGIAIMTAVETIVFVLIFWRKSKIRVLLDKNLKRII